MTLLREETHFTSQSLLKNTEHAPQTAGSTSRVGWSVSPMLSAKLELEIQRLRSILSIPEAKYIDKESSSNSSNSLPKPSARAFEQSREDREPLHWEHTRSESDPDIPKLQSFPDFADPDTRRQEGVHLRSEGLPLRSEAQGNSWIAGQERTRLPGFSNRRSLFTSRLWWERPLEQRSGNAAIIEPEKQVLEAQHYNSKMSATVTLPLNYIWNLESSLSHFVSQTRLRYDESRSIFAAKTGEIGRLQSENMMLKLSQERLREATRKCEDDLVELASKIDTVEDRVTKLEAGTSSAEQRTDAVQQMQQDIKNLWTYHNSIAHGLEREPPIWNDRTSQRKEWDCGTSHRAQCGSPIPSSIADSDQISWDNDIE